MRPSPLRWALPLALTLIWLVSINTWPDTIWSWRNQLLILTGTLGLAAMIASVLLALRLPRFERLCGGLDRMLRLHRSTALWATGLLVLHWLIVESPKWAVSAGWLTRPQRRGAPAGAGPSEFNALLHSVGNTLGEWSFYLLIVLVVVSLLAAIRYEKFRAIHKLAPVIYLGGYIHALCMLPRIGLLSPLGITLIVGGTLGAIGALYSLFGRVGKRDQLCGQVSTLNRLDSRTLEITMQLAAPLGNYQSGQFAFFRFAGSREDHPFTLLHCSPDGRTIKIAVRDLGDHTHWLQQALKVGDAVQVTGPYGAFTLPSQPNGLWLAAGIGIAPFIAWLEQLAERGEQRHGTTLLQCAPDEQEVPYRQRLTELCRQTGVAYRLHLDCQSGMMDLDALAATQHAPVWFCGPEKMADLLQARLQVPFQRELFRFR